ncbi:hypothetical protein BT69DRAFT_1300594 [Atractiella rhizophila]|nr:hypothetical protein BT69DRAFT_1300594 [Atractiella rhizophila]
MSRSNSLSLPIPNANSRERTLALLATKAVIRDRTNVESRLVGSGFDVIAEREVGPEEVEGWGFGNAAEVVRKERLAKEGEQTQLFAVIAYYRVLGPFLLLVIERAAAFAVWRDLINAPGPNSLKNLYPPGSLLSPAVPQLVEEAITNFFPQLPPLNSPLPSPKPQASPRLFGKETSVSPQLQRKILPPPSPLPEEEEVQVEEEVAEEGYEEELYEEEIYEDEDGQQQRRVVQRNGSASPNFRARPLPATHLQPDIQPRMSRAAALRMGLELANEPKTPRPSGPKEPDLITPGVNQRPLRDDEVPLSLAAPAIAPRQTRASALRNGEAVAKPTRKRDPNAPKEKDLVTPGVNKRPLAEHELPKSLKGPTFTPRPTKAALLRQNGAGSPSPSANFRRSVTLPRRSSSEASGLNSPIFDGIPGHKRRESVPVKSTAPPTITPRGTRSSSLRTGDSQDYFNSRSASKSPNPSTPSTTGVSGRASFDGVPGHKRVEKIEVKSTKAPTIAPRLTKAAALRTGVMSPPPRERRERSLEDVPEENLFQNVPGHKRVERIAVKSTNAPTVAPRLTKSASLRAMPKKTEEIPAWERRMMKKRVSVGRLSSAGFGVTAKVNIKSPEEDEAEFGAGSDEGTVKDGNYTTFESF